MERDMLPDFFPIEHFCGLAPPFLLFVKKMTSVLCAGTNYLILIISEK